MHHCAPAQEVGGLVSYSGCAEPKTGQGREGAEDRGCRLGEPGSVPVDSLQAG